jgi:hypothetical protein
MTFDIVMPSQNKISWTTEVILAYIMMWTLTKEEISNGPKELHTDIGSLIGILIKWNIEKVLNFFLFPLTAI